MSIEMNNPITLLEKADTAANFIEQMQLAHTMKDEARFKEAHRKASDLMFDVVREIEEKEDAQ